MTDSSSNDPVMAELAGDLIQAKMDASKMTHLLRIGTFQMEIAPNEKVDVRAFFNETIDKLIGAYGEKLLEIDIKTAQMQSGNMHQ
jgi:hypothetical protein|tara:strand:- start:3174 stop:3431 length:258 start_codon:yes stop_codon:yes gene_type:complete